MPQEFPTTDWKTFPLSLGDLLAALAERGHLGHLSVMSTSVPGQCQAAFKVTGGNGYAVAISGDVREAILTAIAPGYGHSWAELLGPAWPGDPTPDEDLEDVLG